MITLCTLHGESTHGRKACCFVSRQARGAYKRYLRQHPDRAEGLVMCAVHKDNPDHGAVCADPYERHYSADERARDMLRCLKNEMRTVKAQRTKAQRAAAAAAGGAR